MSDPSGLKSVADAMDDIRLREEIERYDEEKDPAARAKELADAGYDPVALQARILAARDAAFAGDAGADDGGAAPAAPPAPASASVPAPAPAPPPAPTAKVLPFAGAKARRALVSTWFAVAAGATLVVGGGGYQYAASYRPPARNDDYPRYVAPPTQEELAAILERRGLRLCDLGYYGECRDTLDQADRLDPGTEKHPAVERARAAISSAESGQSPIRMPDNISKPQLGPGERPLQRHP